MRDYAKGRHEFTTKEIENEFGIPYSSALMAAVFLVKFPYSGLREYLGVLPVRRHDFQFEQWWAKPHFQGGVVAQATGLSFLRFDMISPIKPDPSKMNPAGKGTAAVPESALNPLRIKPELLPEEMVRLVIG